MPVNTFLEQNEKYPTLAPEADQVRNIANFLQNKIKKNDIRIMLFVNQFLWFIAYGDRDSYKNQQIITTSLLQYSHSNTWYYQLRIITITTEMYLTESKSLLSMSCPK